MKKIRLIQFLFLLLYASSLLAQSLIPETKTSQRSAREIYFESLRVYEKSCDLTRDDNYLKIRAANCYMYARKLEENQSVLNSTLMRFYKTCEELKNNSPLCNYKSVIDIYEKACLLGEKESCNGKVFERLNQRCSAGDSRSCNILSTGIKNVDEDKSSAILLYGSLLLLGIAVLIIAKTIFQDEEEFKASEKIEEAGKNLEKNNHGIILKYSRPFFKRYISPIVASMKGKKKFKDKYKRKLASAGLTSYITPEDFYSFKLFLIFGFPIVFFGVREFIEETWELKNMIYLAIGGYFYPDIWISQKIKMRQNEIMGNMPFAVDMLALSVEAGLDFIAAMTKVVEKAKPSALNDEFEILLREIKIGASRAEALRNMAWRIDMIQVSSFCATLIAADSVGASIGPILKSLSAEIRQKRSTDIEKKGATAATKILFPMIFFIVPAVMLIIMIPLAMDAISGGGN